MIKKIILVGICFVIGLSFAYVYQPVDKTMKIYSHAMKDYANKDFQNSYYLFSKVGFFSQLKPYAVYHQAMCAKALDDKKSEMKQYQILINNYSKNILSLRAKYLLAQMMLEENPSQAKTYFEQIIKSNPDTDYAIASEYYLGLIKMNKYKREDSVFPTSEKLEVETAFRHYLKKAPQGRHALNAAGYWLGLDVDISQDDYLILANTYYMFDNHEKTRELLTRTDLKESWVLDVKNSYKLKNYQRSKELAIYGLQNYAQYSDEKDIRDVIDIYMVISTSKTSDIDMLYSISSPKGKDYIWTLKCDAAQEQFQENCFKQLYINFPNSNYGADAMANLFFAKIKDRDYKSAIKIGEDYVRKFENTPTAPMVMFWLGKVYERENNYDAYMNYYKKTILTYPDTYYAYRAYLAMKHVTSPLFNSKIVPQPVAYPYPSVSKRDVIFKLAELKDYDVLELLSDDDFVKSWIYYEKGDFTHSMLVARDAMEKINPKPDRNDLRWRLVYPVNYFDIILNNSGSNNPVLMLALVREESFFNPKAQSGVGARGLMQLMPSTAKEVGKSNGFIIDDMDDLFKPEFNIRLGNAYYSSIRSMLNNMDISAIAAYNGGYGSVEKWKKSFVYSDTDEFVEQIPYTETKNYVKKVFRSYWNYLRIYVE